MSEDASRMSPWPTSPDFGDSPRGYWGYEVDRLLEKLKAADAAGEPLGPIIDGQKLSEVGFGYSMPEVDAHLALLRGRSVSRTTSTVSGSPAETPGGARADASPAAVPQIPPTKLSEIPGNDSTGATPVAEPEAVQETVELATVAGAALIPLSGPRADMLAEIKRAAALPRPPGRAAGYAAADVDSFLSELTIAIRADQYVLPTLQRSQFAMAKGGAPGYDVKEVDLLLDRLEGMASSAAAPQQLRAYQPNPYDKRTVEHNPYHGFNSPSEVRRGRPKSIVRTIISTAVFLFILYNFFRVWTGFGF